MVALLYSQMRRLGAAFWSLKRSKNDRKKVHAFEKKDLIGSFSAELVINEVLLA